MQVSSDTLFHFTPTLANLTGILKDKFKISYCYENYVLDGEFNNSYYPMVSFCDIPLSLAKNHIQSYGAYAVGMTKEWGIQKKMNPVVYIEKDSFLAKDMHQSLKLLVEMAKILTEQVTAARDNISDLVDIVKGTLNQFGSSSTPAEKEVLNQSMLGNIRRISTHVDHVVKAHKFNPPITNIADTFGNMFRYTKNYEGELVRQGKKIRRYRFYDEREWRFVPEIKDKKIKKWLNKDEFLEYRNSATKKPFVPNSVLSFGSDDIKYLIVKSKSDIPKLITAIKKTENLNKTAFASEILSTKIITVEQLYTDF